MLREDIFKRQQYMEYWTLVCLNEIVIHFLLYIYIDLYRANFENMFSYVCKWSTCVALNSLTNILYHSIHSSIKFIFSYVNYYL